MKKPVYLLDGYSLIYRTYFAFMKNPLRNREGKNISVVFGAARFLINFFNKKKPENFAVILDSIEPTFRHKMYAEYKATREKAPEELHEQIPLVEELFSKMNIPSIRVNGYEADDIIATIAVKAVEENRECYFISGDKDLLQLVGNGVYMLKPDKSDFITMNKETVIEKWGVQPTQIIDFLSLTGDSSDNVPGVKGIGKKTAEKLLSAHKDLKGVYNNIEKIAGASIKQKIADGKESAFLSKKLVTLDKNVPLEINMEDIRIANHDLSLGAAYLRELGIDSLAEELGQDSQTVTAAQKKGDYETITTSKALKRIVNTAIETGTAALDVETNSINPHLAALVGISVSCKAETGAYIPLQAHDTDCLDFDTVKTEIQRMLDAPRIQLIGQNFKYDLHVLTRHGFSVPGIYFDTMIAAWLCDSRIGKYGMEALARHYFNYRTIHYSDVVPKGKDFSAVAIETATQYAAEDADITFRLYEHLSKEISAQGLEERFHSLEMPVLMLLAKMEHVGIGIDTKALHSYSKELSSLLDSITAEIYELCGKKFNINSTKQLQEVLFGDLGLTPVKKTKTGYSTDTSVLEQLKEAHPVPEKILTHRSLAKLKSTYVDTLPELVNKHTGRIHTSFLQTGTQTGRLSSKDPNLQNIPIKTNEGRRIRTAFIPKPGNVFISADYSQIELVILAHLSGDKSLCQAFTEGMDIHTHTASLIFDTHEDLVTADQRRAAKTINFGVMYGMGGFRLSRQLGISRKQADSFISNYFETYSGIKQFVAETTASAEDKGFVETIMGRRRHIPGITSRNRTEKMAAERIAVNTPIQGSAADIVKKAMLDVDRSITEQKINARILLQVHDELIIEVEKTQAGQCRELVRSVMEKAYVLKIPLRVNAEEGPNWGAMH